MLHLPFLEEAVKLVQSKKQVVGDGTDRLVSYITAMIFAFCAMIVAGKQLMGSAMTCFIPGHYKGDQSKYALDYCYIQNTYVVAWHDADIALNRGEHNYDKISYYQWVALFFAFLAVLFYLPSHLWKNFSRTKRINLEHIVAKTSEIRTELPEDRQKGLEVATSSVIEAIRASRSVPRGSIKFCFRDMFSLTMIYFLSKAVNILIVVYTLFKVAKFLHDDDFAWSFHGIEALLTGSPWVDSPNFPRVTMCDVPIREMGNVRKETFQCLLGMNYFSEKLFVTQWVWLTVVLVITLANLAVYCHIFIASARRHRLAQWLRDSAVNSKITDEHVEKFLQLLGIDGYLALYFVNSYNGSKAAGEFADYIYRKMEAEITENNNNLDLTSIEIPHLELENKIPLS